MDFGDLDVEEVGREGVGDSNKVSSTLRKYGGNSPLSDRLSKIARMSLMLTMLQMNLSTAVYKMEEISDKIFTPSLKYGHLSPK